MQRAWRAVMVMAAAVVMIGVTKPAAADPVDMAIWVTAGSYSTESGSDFFTFTGPVVDLHQTSGATPDKVFASTCGACTAGDTVNMSFRNPPFDANGFTQFVDLGSGDGRIDAQTYPFLSFSGSLKFMATPTLFPATTASSVMLDTPFSFRGWMRAATHPPPFTGGTEFRLRGLGTASQMFVREGGVYRASGNPTYTFQAVTPEPSSLLLLGTGIVALGRRLRRKP
jgi:hypothetical protein